MAIPESSGGEKGRGVPRPSGRSRRQLRLSLSAGGLVAAGVALLLVGPDPRAIVLTIATYGVALWLTVWLWRRGFLHPSLGVANTITVVRLGLVASLIAPLLAPAEPAGIITVAMIALVLDGVDGWFARRRNRVSTFGARLDIEVDAGLTVVLALNALVSESVGPLVLLLVLPRYLWVLTGRFLPWLRGALPERQSRKVVTVIQTGTLITLQLPFVAGHYSTALVLAVGGIVLFSFGQDVIWLARRRPQHTLRLDS